MAPVIGGKSKEDKNHEETESRTMLFYNQKLYGLFITVLSFILLLLTQDGFTIFGIVAGVAVMVTKEMVIYNEYYRTHGGMEQWIDD